MLYIVYHISSIIYYMLYVSFRNDSPDQRRKLYRRRVGATRNHLGIHVGTILEPSWMGFGTHYDHVAAGKNRKQFYFGNKCCARKLGSKTNFLLKTRFSSKENEFLVWSVSVAIENCCNRNLLHAMLVACDLCCNRFSLRTKSQTKENKTMTKQCSANKAENKTQTKQWRLGGCAHPPPPSSPLPIPQKMGWCNVVGEGWGGPFTTFWLGNGCVANWLGRGRGEGGTGKRRERVEKGKGKRREREIWYQRSFPA